MRWTTDTIVEATGGRLMYGRRDKAFAGVGIDSRTIRADGLFVAICGELHDGHTFVEQVAGKGVKGVVVQPEATLPHETLEARGMVCVAVEDTTTALGRLAAYQRGQWQIPVVAITGSNGKTTTRQMTASVMAQRFNTLATRGNLNNEIGVPLTLFGLTEAHQMAVLELGMNHFGEIGRLGAICQPTIGMITNVGPAHLEFLGSLEGVARAKGELIDTISEQGWLVLNQDDVRVAALADKARCRTFFFGTTEGADISASDIKERSDGITFELKLPSDQALIELKTPGRFMMPNALAAASAGHLAGLSLYEIKAGLEMFEPLKGRLRVVEADNGLKVIDDTYNANPASMAAAFDTLTTLRKSRPGIIVMGDMLELGDRSEELHHQAGSQAAASGVGRIYAHGNFAPNVARGALEAGLASEAILTGTKEAIVADLIGRLTPNHWILVKGSRGMAMETVVAAILNWANERSGG